MYRLRVTETLRTQPAVTIRLEATADRLKRWRMEVPRKWELQEDDARRLPLATPTEYVARNEVWIDDDVHDDERGFILFHELFEQRLVSEGMTYDQAHKKASKREGYFRQHPAELHEALADEGWE